MLTIHILTKNNVHTLPKALDSIACLKTTVLVGDLGSTDGTTDLCRSREAVVFQLGNRRRDEARNIMLDRAASGMHFYLEPWEALMQGREAMTKIKGVSDVRVVRGTSIVNEVRIWDGRHRFINPVFERLDVEDGAPSPVVVSSSGGLQAEYAINEIETWKADKPLSSTPYYYQSCVLLAEARYDDFLKVADHYLFIEKEINMATVMTRYYYAMVQLLHKRAYKSVLQNLNLCLCAKPLMAEFWCLTGDVYYHLLNRFDQAREFYYNAMILGRDGSKATAGRLILPSTRNIQR